MRKINVGDKIRFLGRDGMGEPCECLFDLPVGHETIVIASGEVLVVNDSKGEGIIVLHHEVELVLTDPSGTVRSLTDIQVNLPWTIRYSADFRSNPQPHKDFAHALTHIFKAGGQLAALVDAMDHRKETADSREIRPIGEKYIADMVICALRMANTFPGGPIDLQRAVIERLETKNGVTLPRGGA